MRNISGVQQTQRLSARNMVILRVRLRRAFYIWSSSDKRIVLSPFQYHAEMTELGMNGSVLDSVGAPLKRMSSAVVNRNNFALEVPKPELEGFPRVRHCL